MKIVIGTVQWGIKYGVSNHSGIPTDIEIEKILNYANKNDIPYVIFYGDEEKEKNCYNLKEMKTGKQEILDKEKLIKILVRN